MHGAHCGANRQDVHVHMDNGLTHHLFENSGSKKKQQQQHTNNI